MKILIPCIVGAIIGYITNWLAIKMLFRPYAEKRILGFKVPFTPGLIPKEQKRIAKNVGETVGEHLLSKENLINALCSEEVYNHIEILVKDKVRNIATSEKKLSDILSPLRSDIYDNLKELKNKDSFKETIESILIEKKEDIILNNYKVSDLIGDKPVYGFKSYISENRLDISLYILSMIKDPGNAMKLKNAISKGIADNVNPLMAMFVNGDAIYNKIITFIEGNIYKDNVQEEIVMALNKLIDKGCNKEVKEFIMYLDNEYNNEGLTYISDKICNEICNEGTINKLIDKIMSLSIKDILSGKEEKISIILVDLVKGAYGKFIENQGEELVDLLNVKGIVENQINTFPVDFAEELILSIASKELKAITWLGALLGGIIGLLNPLINSLYI
ncbi:DUF445 domain-containing protein [Clostridium sp.]|uniref:DUF445 domain-containing protein n=1 Tax=Clostridium sp. TaxID=1506 RepID=UPI0034638DA9